MMPHRQRIRAQRLQRGGCAHRGRGGYTLTELLIVVVIMIILVAITLPVARKIMDDTQTREASRQLNAYLAMAQARAAQSGRPAGLYLALQQPLGAIGTERMATQMYLAEVPPPYVGGTLDARGGIFSDGTNNVFLPVSAVTGTTDTNEVQYLQHLIGPGELFMVRFSFKGPWYRCQRGINPNLGNPTLTDPTKFYYLGLTQGGAAVPVPPGYGTTPNYAAARPFQILLPPRRFGSPLELSGGTCVDITYSGIGPRTNYFHTVGALESVIVMFQPGGGIDSVWIDKGVSGASLSGMVHFLVGKVEKVKDPSTNYVDPEVSNLADPNSLWVSINRQAGGVITTDNLFNPAAVQGPGDGSLLEAHIREARRAATSREQKGGR